MFRFVCAESGNPNKKSDSLQRMRSNPKEQNFVKLREVRNSVKVLKPNLASISWHQTDSQKQEFWVKWKRIALLLCQAKGDTIGSSPQNCVS